MIKSGNVTKLFKSFREAIKKKSPKFFTLWVWTPTPKSVIIHNLIF